MVAVRTTARGCSHSQFGRQCGQVAHRCELALISSAFAIACSLSSRTPEPARTHAFLYELISETHPDFGGSPISYQYNLNGSRTKRTTSAGIDYYGVDVAEKLLWVNRGVNTTPISGQASPYTLYQYDANGRMSRRERKYAVGGTIQTYDFFWDGDDRLRQVKQGAASRFSATYDGDGLRVTKTDLFSATYTYSRGPGGVLYDGATTYTPGLGHRYTGINPRFYHSDWVGSTCYLSDSSGNFFPSALRYDAFGNRTALAGPNQPTPFQFAGGWGYEAEYSDSTEPYLGLSYLEQRYYEPATGRFISRDPIGFAGGLNLYAYCDNDPVDMVDPDGLGGVWIGGVHLGDDHPWLVFDAPGLAAGLGTGVAAVGSAGTFGLWDGGDAQCQPGFGVSRGLAAFGRDILLWEAGASLLGRAAPLLARIPRPALRLRPGFARIPGLGGRGIRAIGTEGEEAVSQAIGVPRNVGPGRATVPGTGPGGFRVPDFSPAATIAARGTVVEVKNVQVLKITQQLRDLIAYARSRGVPLEIFTNGRVPATGELAGEIAAGRVVIRRIP
jgi:RHS repeat-associated protein